jgi:uncharacterized caspase-like protein
VRALAAAFALVAAAAQPVAAQEAKPARVALVIGNSAYREAPLPNTANDAADMARALEASGFAVIRRDNASLKEMQLAIRDFGDRLGRGSVGLFYFAGHGVQARGRNYLVPVDADIAREDEVAYSALDLAAVLDKMDSARNPMNLVILDACRNNPFATRFQLSAPGLAQIDAPVGTLIAFSTAPGSVASDGTGRNGLYTQHLLREIERPGAAVEEVFKAVRAAVRRDSGGRQVPWESTSLETAFAFREAPRPAPAKIAAAAPAPAGKGATRAVPASLGAPPALAVGDQWRYRQRNLLTGEERPLSLRIRAMKGDEVHYEGGHVTDVVGNTIKGRVRDKPTTYTPASLLYAFPLAPGARYPLRTVQDTDGRLYDLEGEVAVVGEEEIEVPAGRMRAIRVEREVRWRERGRENAGVTNMTYWYSSAVKRAVAIETRNASLKGKLFSHERMDLEQFDVR